MVQASTLVSPRPSTLLRGNSLKVPLPRSRLMGCSCKSPVAYFYIHHAESSIRELHPFTTITPLAAQNAATPLVEDDFPIQFLFRKRGQPTTNTFHNVTRFNRFLSLSRMFRSKEQRLRSTEWTDKLANLVDKEHQSPTQTVSASSLEVITTTRKDQTSPLSPCSPRPTYPKIDIGIRLEGPYFSPADPYRYDTVVCLVAGTGISGAIAIGGAFTELQRQRSGSYDNKNCCRGGSCTHTSNLASTWDRCVIVWSVKASDVVELPFLASSPGVEVQTHLTGEGRKRIDMRATIEGIKNEGGGNMWVYVSGPTPFLESGKTACKAVPKVDVYAPSWDI